jgi:hypothetical protein
MKKLALLLIAISALLSGCVAYEVPGGDHGSYRGDRERDRDGSGHRGDRDRNGTPDRHDRGPDGQRY